MCWGLQPCASLPGSFKVIHPTETTDREPPKHTKRSSADGRVPKPKSHQVGLQIPLLIGPAGMHRGRRTASLRPAHCGAMSLERAVDLLSITTSTRSALPNVL